MNRSSFTAAICALCVFPLAVAEHAWAAPATAGATSCADSGFAQRADASPESPADAFARLLGPCEPSRSGAAAPREPSRSSAFAPRDVDPLLPAFHAALWTVPSAQQQTPRPQDAGESPAAAFARLLAPRTPATSAAIVVRTVDPLAAPFHAALWTGQPRPPIGLAAGPQHPEMP